MHLVAVLDKWSRGQPLLTGCQWQRQAEAYFRPIMAISPTFWSGGDALCFAPPTFSGVDIFVLMVSWFSPKLLGPIQELIIRRWDTRTWRNISAICLLIYHWTMTHLYFWNIFWVTRTCYISNGRRFTKSALRILRLSTFRVSSINYSLASSLPIHTWSSTNAEGPRAHCQLKSCKMLYRCSTDCIWKSQRPENDLQGHSTSLTLLPFDRPYTISY